MTKKTTIANRLGCKRHVLMQGFKSCKYRTYCWLAQNKSQKAYPKKLKNLINKFIKIVQNQTPLDYKYTIQGVVCIPIPQLLKF